MLSSDISRPGSYCQKLGPRYATIATVMPEELSPSQAAARIGATTRSVQRWIAAGRLPARRVGGRWRVASDAIDAFIAGDGNPIQMPASRASAAAPGATPIHAVFVANRGEIAARITRTCVRLGIRSIVPETDGPDGLDLLDIGGVVDAALSSGADAVHPGFGFLAENADFAEAVIATRILWVGPPLYYAVSIGILFPHSVPLLVYFVVITALGVALLR